MTRQQPRISEEAYRVLTETASDAIVTMDEQSVILSVNPATERIFGYQASELVGEKMSLLMPERMRALHRDGVNRYLATGKKHIPWNAVQVPALRKDGGEIPVEISFGEFMDGDRHVFTGFIRDISERVRAQRALEDAALELEASVEELRARAREAEAANQAKSAFLATMSHELRTPLNATSGYADLLLAGIPEPIPAASKLQVERIRLASKHLLSIIEEILAFARIEAGVETVSTERVNLEELVQEVCAVIQPLAAGKRIGFKVLDSLPPLALCTDSGKLRQILINLLGNAVKFTDTGEVSFDIRQDGNSAVFVVQDTGIGIAAEDVNHIWEPFQQLDNTNTRRAGGTGLGLSVSRELARLLGGDIAVESAPGRGSTFTVRLPLRPTASPE